MICNDSSSNGQHDNTNSKTTFQNATNVGHPKNGLYHQQTNVLINAQHHFVAVKNTIKDQNQQCIVFPKNGYHHQKINQSQQTAVQRSSFNYYPAVVVDNVDQEYDKHRTKIQMKLKRQWSVIQRHASSPTSYNETDAKIILREAKRALSIDREIKSIDIETSEPLSNDKHGTKASPEKQLHSSHNDDPSGTCMNELKPQGSVTTTAGFISLPIENNHEEKCASLMLQGDQTLLCPPAKRRKNSSSLSNEASTELGCFIGDDDIETILSVLF